MTFLHQMVDMLRHKSGFISMIVKNELEIIYSFAEIFCLRDNLI